METPQQPREITIYTVYNENNVFITKENIKKILRKGGIRRDIQNLDIFQEAFVHESYCNKTDFLKNEKYFGRYEPYDVTRPDHQNVIPLQNKTGERLEWLGDGILQSVIANYLFKRYEDQQEGFLTKLRSKLVKTDTLAKLSRKMGFDRYIMMSKQKELVGGGRNDERILEDAFEAFIGAMSIEFGSEDEVEGYRVCRDFLLKVFEDNIDFTALIMKEDNYKDQLMRYFHKVYDKYNPVYEVKNVELVENESGLTSRKYHIAVRNIDGEIVGEGVSFMKKDAEVKAAKAALQHYGIMDGY